MTIGRMLRRARWLPFLLLSAAALVSAYFPHLPRKPFSLSLDLSIRTVAHVAYKPIHYRAAAVLFLLAILAVGSRRVPFALGLTLIVCFGIELEEATVAGHSGRLADMLSYVIGAAIGLLVYLGAGAIAHRTHRNAKTESNSFSAIN
jgi:hypothetical protein